MTTLSKSREKTSVKKMKFSRNNGFGDNIILTCFDNGRIILTNDLKIVLSLSNVMFNAGLKTGYIGEQDTLKGALRDTIADFSKGNAEEVLSVLKKTTKLNDWIIVE